MGLFIFIIFSFLTLGLMVFCLITKSNQTKLKGILPISVFALFLLLTLLSVIRWGFQYYALSIALFLFAVWGIYQIISNKEKPFRPVKTIIKTIAIILMFAIVTTPILIFPQYKPLKTTGNYSVDTMLTTYTDTSRKETFSKKEAFREVNAEFWFPKDATGTFPLIIFSHGAYGLRTSNESTYEELASNGYVVCALDHPYHALFAKTASGNISMTNQEFLQEVTNLNNGKYNETEQIALTNKWLRLRTDDLNFVINTIEAKVTEQADFYSMIDSSTLGILGHSLGGSAAVELGRIRSDVKAVINLDGDLLGEYLSYENHIPVIKKDAYPIPLLNIWSDNMIDGMNEYPDIQFPHQYLAVASDNTYNLHIKGTNHFSYTDLPVFSPFLAKMILSTVAIDEKSIANPRETINETNAIILSFFNAYLKQEGEFSSKYLMP